MNTNKKNLFLSTLLAAAVLAPLPAHAWDREGHRLTALVAMDHLTPVAAANVKAILGPDTMADVAPWADEYRQDHPETGAWHYTDIPKSEERFDHMRDCPAPANDPNATVRNCSVDRVIDFENQLKNPALPQDQKLFALKMLIHLMGDLHQPFHSIGDARGGNQIIITEFGATTCGGWPTCNLHAMWDGDLIERHNLSEKKYVDTLEEEIRKNHWDQEATVGNIVHWVNQGHAYAANAWVPNGAHVPPSYYTEFITIVDQQLSLGGLRLANALNAIFTTPPPTAAK